MLSSFSRRIHSKVSGHQRYSVAPRCLLYLSTGVWENAPYVFVQHFSLHFSIAVASFFSPTGIILIICSSKRRKSGGGGGERINNNGRVWRWQLELLLGCGLALTTLITTGGCFLWTPSNQRMLTLWLDFKGEKGRWGRNGRLKTSWFGDAQKYIE